MTPDTNTPLPAWVEEELQRLEAAADKCTWAELEAWLLEKQTTWDTEIAHEIADNLLCIGIMKAGRDEAGIVHMKRLVGIWLQVEDA